MRTERRKLLCWLLGHKVKRGYHSAGWTLYCARCRRSYTVRNYS